ncbi:MAG: DUF5011 domain-containing protein [Bacilli bacterium]|nr:DUF5011 domain-containing protein [Bacilli bacterium]
MEQDELETERKIKKVERKQKKYLKKVSIIGVILLSIILLVLLIYFLFVPKITLIGDKYIKVEYGDKYKDPGVKATYLGKNITDKSWIEGKVDENKLGVYHLKYKIRKNKFTSTVERDIEVVDTKEPVITIVGENEISVCPAKEYVEEGYTALDNYDGDLTDKVNVETFDTEVIYKVKDSSGNEGVSKRVLNRIDEEAPVITLKGGDTYYVVLNSTFTDPLYTVSDNCDEDLTSKVTVSGSVDTKKLGTYELSYTVSDTKGNTATKTRKVVVSEKKVTPVSTGNLTCGSAGVIYLTFDDGPNSYYTPKILDVLKKYDVKATFFVTAAGPDSLIKREFDEGHVIGLHSSSHDYANIYKSSEAFWTDMNKIASRVERITGKKSDLLRFPGGVSNTVSRKYKSGIMTQLAKEVEDNGYVYFDWNISSGDAGGLKSASFNGKVSEEISNVTRNLSKSRGNVILMHDIKQTTASAIEEIIKYGKNNGYKFEVLNKNIICHQRINN